MGLRIRMDFDPSAIAMRAERAASGAARAAGEAIMLRSGALAPRKSGAMAASARVEVEGTKARVSYDVPYARIQHERADLNHPRGGQAGFLSAAVSSGEAIRAMEEAFKQGWKG